MEHTRFGNFNLSDEEKLRTHGLYKSASFNHFAKMSEQELMKYYYTLPKLGQTSAASSAIGTKLAPLAQFDDKDFELPKPSKHRQKVKLFKALLIFFSSVVMIVGLASIALGLFFILDEERVQMHQIILVNLKNVKDVASSEAQPMLYFLSIALVGSGFLMILASMGNFMATSKENQFWIVMAVFCYTSLFASQLTLGFFGVSFHLRAQEDLRSELVSRLQKQYNEPGGEFFTPALDYVQTRFKCCGISKEEDYNNSKWKELALGGEELKYPLTCCILHNANDLHSYLNPIPRSTQKCMSNDSRVSRQHRHHQGCIHDILGWATLDFVVIVAVSIGCAIVEMMSACISFYLMKHLRRKSQDGS